MPHAITDDVRYRLLTFLSAYPDASQRQLARALGVSLGKANYCVRAVMSRGLVKMRKFRNSGNKRTYRYVLTPTGMEEKVRLTFAFLRRKIGEYDLLREEIERLRDEVQKMTATG